MEEFWKATYTGAKVVGKLVEGLSQEELDGAPQFGWITSRRQES
jgi:hypothetical protein